MTESDKIITLARNYCLALFNQGLSTQQRIAKALLNGVEYLVGKQFSSIYLLKDEISRIALASLKEQTVGYTKEGHLNKIELEKQNFLRYIEQLDPDRIENIEPLPYKRRLSESETEMVKQNLKDKWNFDGWSNENYYWEPLVSASPKPTYFFNTEILDDKDFQNIGNLLLELSADPIFEITEDRIDYEIYAKEFDQNYSEAAYTDKRYNWIIYLSHEGTIAFGGDELMKKVDLLLVDKMEQKDKW